MGIFFALLLTRLRPRAATLSQKYFLDKRCESFFSCSLSADSSLCTGDQPSALEFKRSAPSGRQLAPAQRGLSQT